MTKSFQIVNMSSGNDTRELTGEELALVSGGFGIPHIDWGEVASSALRGGVAQAPGEALRGAVFGFVLAGPEGAAAGALRGGAQGFARGAVAGGVRDAVHQVTHH